MEDIQTRSDAKAYSTNLLTMKNKTEESIALAKKAVDDNEK